MGAKILPKITLRKTGLEVEQLTKLVLDDKKSQHVVLRVAGKITKAKECDGDIGPYTEYYGSHRAINLITGETYEAKKILMPQLCEVYLDSIASVVENDENAISVAYGMDIYVEYNTSAKKAKEYIYGFYPIVERSGDDELSLLFDTLPELPTKLLQDKKGKKK